MKRYKALLITILFLIAISAVWVQANGTSWFLQNGYQALFYHAMRIEESFPRMNPIGMAIDEFEKAIRDGSGEGEANLMIGMIYQYMNRPGTALGYYLEFATSHPEEVWIHSLIGDLYAEMGRLDEAQRSYELAIANQGEEDVFAQAYLGLGNTALERKEYVKAKEAFERALASAGDFFDARFALGKAFYYLGDYDEAIATLEQAQLQAPRSISLHYYLGLSYEAAGRHDQANHSFTRVTELQGQK